MAEPDSLAVEDRVFVTQYAKTSDNAGAVQIMEKAFALPQYKEAVGSISEHRDALRHIIKMGAEAASRGEDLYPLTPGIKAYLRHRDLLKTQIDTVTPLLMESISKASEGHVVSEEAKQGKAL